MTIGDPAEIAALFEVVASETEALHDLEGAVGRLRAAHTAKQTLARMAPDALRAGLLRRRNGELR